MGWFGTLYLLAGVFIAVKGRRILFVLLKDPWIISLIILSGLSCFWSVNLSITFASFRSLIVQYILVGYLVTTYSLRKIIGFVSKTLAFMGALSCLYLIFIPELGLSIGQHGGVSWRGVFLHQSVLAGSMALAVVSIAYTFAMEWDNIRSRISKIFILSVIGICLWLLFFCGAKTSVVGFILSCSILPFFFIERIKGMRARNLIFVFLVYIFCIGIPLVYFSQEFIIVEVLGKNPTLSGRDVLWEYLLPRALEKPFGYGLNAFWFNKILEQGVIDATGYNYGNSHSNYFDLLLGLGFPGVVLLFFSVVTVVRRTIILAFNYGLVEFRWALQILIILLVGSYSDVFIGFLTARTIGWFIFCVISIKSILALEKLREPAVDKANYYSIYKSRRSQLN
ncbi:MAG: O-antigen ligase family protein [Phormidesmis sp.]